MLNRDIFSHDIPDAPRGRRNGVSTPRSAGRTSEKSYPFIRPSESNPPPPRPLVPINLIDARGSVSAEKRVHESRNVLDWWRFVRRSVRRGQYGWKDVYVSNLSRRRELLKGVMCARNEGDGRFGRLDCDIHTDLSKIKCCVTDFTVWRVKAKPHRSRCTR